MLGRLGLLVMLMLPLLAQEAPVEFRCPGGEQIRVQFEDERAIAEVSGHPRIVLPRAMSASGARYSDGYTTLWNKGDEVRFTSGEFSVSGCREAKAQSANVLQGMFVYDADGSLFTACSSGQSYRVIQEGAIGDLEAAWNANSAGPGGAVFLRAEGRMEMRKVGDAPEPAGVVIATKLLGVEKGMDCETALSPLNGKWQLDELQGTPVEATGSPFVEFEAKAKRAAGFGGCNRFSGGYTLDGDALQFSSVAATRMACLGKGMETERKFFEMLEAVRSYSFAEERLRFLDAEGNVIARFARSAPQVP